MIFGTLTFKSVLTSAQSSLGRAMFCHEFKCSQPFTIDCTHLDLDVDPRPLPREPAREDGGAWKAAVLGSATSNRTIASAGR